MRFITGDECGLLKEITTSKPSSRLGNHGNNNGGSSTTGSDPVLPPPQHQQRRINIHDEMTRQHGIIKMIQWDHPHSTTNSTTTTTTTTTSSSTIAALRKNGSVQIWERQPQLLSSSTKKKHRNVNDYHSIRTIPNVFHSNDTPTNSEQRPLGMGQIRTNHDDDMSRVFACASTNGTIALVKLPTNVDHLKEDAVVETISTTLSSSTSSLTSMSLSKSTPPNNDFLNTIPSRISTFATHPTLPRVVMGGKDRDMVLYDLQHCGSSSSSSNSSGSAAPVVLWKAKNLPPHPQTLLQPQIWPTACCFWNPNVLVVGTAYRQIRVYDLRLSSSSQVGTTITSSSSSTLDTRPQQPQRRPILYSSQPMTDYRITALCPLSRNHNSIIVGDAGGTMVSVDLRQLNNITTTTTNHNNSSNTTSRNHTNHLLSPSAITGRYIGPTGCITDIVEWHSPHHKSSSSSSSSLQHCIASVGYDRMVRIYNTKTKQQLHQIYCKQRLNCVLPLLSSDDGYNEDDDEDEHYSNGPNNHRHHQVSDQVEENDDDDIVKDYRNSSSDDDDDDDDDDLSEENEEDIVDEMTATQSSLRDDDNDEGDEEEGEDDDGEDEGEDEDEDDELENDDFVDADEADEEEEENEPIRKRNRRR